MGKRKRVKPLTKGQKALLEKIRKYPKKQYPVELAYELPYPNHV